jgi:predicted RNA-binding protein with PUA-like domain
MAAWLFKTEPTAYALADLARERRTRWSGVNNALALIHLRNVRKGDPVVIYHTGKERQAVGLARAAGDPYADPDAADPKRAVVDLAYGRAFRAPVTLAQFKADRVLAGTGLVRIARLSVVPLDARQLARLLELADGA